MCAPTHRAKTPLQQLGPGMQLMHIQTLNWIHPAGDEHISQSSSRNYHL